MDQLNWTYNNTIFSEDMIGDNYGFVYEITDPNGRKYIGKKFFYSSKTKQVKGKKKKMKVSSDWKTYFGSNEELKGELSKQGKENFTREILYFCKSKAECSYVEAREQFTRKVLESEDYYNGHIQVRVHGSHIKNKLGS